MSSTSRARVLAPLLAAFAVGALGALGGCSSEGVGPGSAAYQSGELGNGGFTFSCADTNLACLEQSSGDAKAFPAGVAKLSSFRVRYVPKPGYESSVNVIIDDTGGSASASAGSKSTGSLEVVGDKYLQKRSDGIFALAPGLGTIVARDASGNLIEFTTIPIREAARLVVYEAAFTGSQSQSSTRSITMKKGEQKSYRVVAQDATAQNLGGSFVTEWKAVDEAVATLDSRDRGVLNLVGLAAGKTTIRVTGLGLSTEVPVEVQP